MTYQIYGSKMANNQQEVISSHRCAISISSVPKLGDLEVPPRLPSAVTDGILDAYICSAIPRPVAVNLGIKSLCLWIWNIACYNFLSICVGFHMYHRYCTSHTYTVYLYICLYTLYKVFCLIFSHL